jgi:hypothetical protein
MRDKSLQATLLICYTRLVNMRCRGGCHWTRATNCETPSPAYLQSTAQCVLARVQAGSWTCPLSNSLTKVKRRTLV